MTLREELEIFVKYNEYKDNSDGYVAGVISNLLGKHPEHEALSLAELAEKYMYWIKIEGPSNYGAEVGGWVIDLFKIERPQKRFVGKTYPAAEQSARAYLESLEDIRK